MKKKAHEDGMKADKTPSMIYYAKLSSKIWWIQPWQDQRQRSINNFSSCLLRNLSGDWLKPFLNEVLATFIGKRASDMLPAPFWKWASTERQQFLVLKVR